MVFAMKDEEYREINLPSIDILGHYDILSESKLSTELLSNIYRDNHRAQ